MPLVEVVPNSTTTAGTPGWSYVVDTGYDPSKAAIVPSGARDRARNSTFVSAAAKESHSARQQAIIAKHLIDLDRENQRDVQIVIPNKPTNVAQRSISGHMTAGVRKILQSNKVWANYLADDEAAAVFQQQQPQSRIAPLPQHEVQTQASLKRKSSAIQTKNTQVKTTQTKAVPTVPPKRGRPPKVKVEPIPMDIDPPHVQQDMVTIEKDKFMPDTTTKLVNEEQDDPFLRLRVPKLPTPTEIEALLSAPPLSYAAARAGPTTSTAPPRQFCEMCGYWSRARCMKCGARVCGLECKTQHEETRCQKFYA